MEQSLLDLLDSPDTSNLGCLLNQLENSPSSDSTLTDLQVYQYPSVDPVSISKELQLPVDPHHWDTSHLLRWVEWTLRQANTDDGELWRIREQLRLQSINGDHLTKWSAFEYDRIFNYSSEYLRQQMTNWLQALHTTDRYSITEDFFLGQAQPGYENEYMNMNSVYNDPIIYQQPMTNHNNMATGQEDYVINYDPSVNYQHMSYTNQRTPEYPPYIWPLLDEQNITIKREPINSGSSDSGESSSDDEDDDFVPSVIRTTRKPTGTKRRHPILYKFILEHLNDPMTSRGYVEWVNKSEGLFRFNSRRKDKFAELWSKAKGKKQPMTYQNMARALRNYTRPNKRIMERVPKKLHYKFVPEFIV